MHMFVVQHLGTIIKPRLARWVNLGPGRPGGWTDPGKVENRQE